MIANRDDGAGAWPEWWHEPEPLFDDLDPGPQRDPDAEQWARDEPDDYPFNLGVPSRRTMIARALPRYL